MRARVGDLGKAVQDVLAERRRVEQAERTTIRALNRALRKLGYEVAQARGPGGGRRRRRRRKAVPSRPPRRRAKRGARS